MISKMQSDRLDDQRWVRMEFFSVLVHFGTPCFFEFAPATSRGALAPPPLRRHFRFVINNRARGNFEKHIVISYRETQRNTIFEPWTFDLKPKPCFLCFRYFIAIEVTTFTKNNRAARGIEPGTSRFLGESTPLRHSDPRKALRKSRKAHQLINMYRFVFRSVSR